jgi:AAA15 family ATPase/GTPase
MWISQLSLENIRGFVGNENVIAPSRNINVIVGQNNSGKSTILNAVYFLQNPYSFTLDDLRKDKEIGNIFLTLENVPNHFNRNKSFLEENHPHIFFRFNKYNSEVNAIIPSLDITKPFNEPIKDNHSKFFFINSNEPDNLIYSHLSKRKVSYGEESVKSEYKNKITGDYRYLNSKIDGLCSSSLPSGDEFRKICKDVLNFPISTVSTDNNNGGKEPVLELSPTSKIPITKMGEGVTSLLGMFVDLCVAENKVFLIEEPENDIHPKALKALLELIIKKSENNQFFISTHSNIVTKYLGSREGAKVFKVSMSFSENRLPISEIEEVENAPIARLRLLEELGYEPFDFGQWKAWLILEESSAEVIIRDFLIPTFVPELMDKLRTYSAGSRDEVEPRFNDFKNLFVFIHLEESYKNRAWVLIDGGEKEKEIIDGMKKTFSKSGWHSENFQQLTHHDFENYYPETFNDEVTRILKLIDKKDKRVQKRNLIEKVKQWAKDNPKQAKKEFAESAKEIVVILRKIAKQVC